MKTGFHGCLSKFKVRFPYVSGVTGSIDRPIPNFNSMIKK